MEIKKQERPLAYIKARELPSIELNEILGGSNKLTNYKVRRQTTHPWGNDTAEEVVWD